MAEYMGGPYNSRSEFSITVDGTVYTAADFKYNSSGELILCLSDASGEKHIDAVVPNFSTTTNKPGAFTSELNAILSNAATVVKTHVADNSVHMTAEDRATMDSLKERNPLSGSLTLELATDPEWASPLPSGTLTNILNRLSDNENYLKSSIGSIASISPSEKSAYDTNGTKLTSHIEDTTIHFKWKDVTDAIDDAIKDKTPEVISVDPAAHAEGSNVIWRTESHNETVDGVTKTWVSATSTFEYTGKITTYGASYGFTADRVINGAAYPVEFESEPQVYLGVTNSYSNTDNYSGVGVWAVCTHTGSKTTMPIVRLQCASSVISELTYKIHVRVEGYTV